jgi:hypothetical protein
MDPGRWRVIRLVLLKDGKAAHTHVIDRLTNVGRGPGNHLVLVDAGVSWNHGTVWLEGSTPWVRDLSSTNGTFVNERRIGGPEPVRPGDHIRFGTTVQVLVEGDGATAFFRDLMLEDVVTGVRFPIRSDRFTLGSRGCDFTVPGPELAATLIIHPGGEIWIGVGADDRPLPIGEEFEVRGRRFALREVGLAHTATIASQPDRYPYRLAVDLDGATGPVATLTHTSTDVGYRIEAGNRAVLLYILARRRKADIEAGKTDAEAGWCTDDEIQTGIWGRQGDANKMHVLIHRVRAEIKKAGFDPWVIEKRLHRVRARVGEVVMASSR